LLCHHDIKQSDKGIWYLDLVDEPNHHYQHSLKGSSSDECHTPLHPWVIKQEFLDFIHSAREGYVFGAKENSALSE
jgi:hypothetical protein